MTTKKSLFIVFEGIDGSGTTTQAQNLQNRLIKQNLPVLCQAEPTNGPIGSLIRQHLLQRVKFDSYTLALLFAADRTDHLFNKRNGVLEFMNKGYTVISDRYYLSSLVYQSIDIEEEFLLKLNSQVIRPDITFFLKIDPIIAMERKRKMTPITEVFEKKEQQEYFAKKYEYFVNEIEKVKKEKIIQIDGQKNSEEISNIVWENISPLLA